MSLADTCPICRGTGDHIPNDTNVPEVGIKHPCHGCGGKGWITVRTDYPPKVYPPTSSHTLKSLHSNFKGI